MKNIAIVPYSKAGFSDQIFSNLESRDDILERFRTLRAVLEKDGYQIHTFDYYEDAREIDVLIFSRYDFQSGYVFRILRKAKKPVILIYTDNESPIICPFHRVGIIDKLPLDIMFTWNDEVVNSASHGYNGTVGGHKVIDTSTIPSVSFSKKKFCCMITSNKHSSLPNELYSERIRLLAYLSKREDVDLYGMGWENTPIQELRSLYKGRVSHKVEALKNYKYAIAFENFRGAPGYITEKIFDCFAAGCVPLYDGAPDIEKHIPRESYIDVRDFQSYEDLYEYLCSINPSQYSKYLDSAKVFLCSKEYEKFTSLGFSKRVVIALKNIGNPRWTYWSAKRRFLGVIISNSRFFLRYLNKYKRMIFDGVIS